MSAAYQDYLSLIELIPNGSPHHYNAGVTLLQLNRDQEAVESFTRAIDLSPNYADAYRGRSMAYTQLGMRGLAAADRARADELDS